MEPAESVKNLGAILGAENSMQWQMPWLAVAWITVTHCFITQKGIHWQTTESSKCLMSYCVQTK